MNSKTCPNDEFKKANKARHSYPYEPLCYRCSHSISTFTPRSTLAPDGCAITLTFAQDKMPHYADCYVFVAERSPQLIRRLIETFLPGGAVQTREEFEIPQYSEQPTHVFYSASELAAFMESHPEETQSVYWHSATAGDYTQANVHFIVGGMVLGVGVPACDRQDEDAILDKLKREFTTEHGFIDYEQPPPNSAKEFLDAAKQCSEQAITFNGY